MGALQTLQAESVSTRPLHADDDQSIAGHGGSLGQSRCAPSLSGLQEARKNLGALELLLLLLLLPAIAIGIAKLHSEAWAGGGCVGNHKPGEALPGTPASLAVQQSNHSGGSHQSCSRRVVGPVESAR